MRRRIVVFLLAAVLLLPVLSASAAWGPSSGTIDHPYVTLYQMGVGYSGAQCVLLVITSDAYAGYTLQFDTLTPLAHGTPQTQYREESFTAGEDFVVMGVAVTFVELDQPDTSLDGTWPVWLSNGVGGFNYTECVWPTP